MCFQKCYFKNFFSVKQAHCTKKMMLCKFRTINYSNSIIKSKNLLDCNICGLAYPILSFLYFLLQVQYLVISKKQNYPTFVMTLFTHKKVNFQTRSHLHKINYS